MLDARRRLCPSRAPRWSAHGAPWCLALVLGGYLLLALGDASAVEKLAVKALFKDAALVVIDGKRRLLRAGQTSPEGVTLHGANSAEADIEVGGKRRSYRLGSTIGALEPRPSGTKVYVYPSRNNLYTAVGSINGFPVEFIVDTGATLVSMNAQEAKRLGIQFRLIGTPATSSTASGLARIYLVTLDRIRVGDIEMRDVAGAVHDGDFPRHVLLGMSFLSRLNMQRNGAVLELERRF